MISFTGALVDCEKIGFYRKLDADKIDRPLNINSSQNEDTLIISFVLHHGNAEAFYGDITFKSDTLILLFGRGVGLREIAKHQYTYQVLNPGKKLPPSVIKDVGTALGNSR